MKLCITGTPGTGKTSVSKNLDRFKVIGITELVEREDLGEDVVIEQLLEALKNEIELQEDTLIEGHLSHHLECDYCVVLRCKPDVLRERLSKRDYPDRKVEQNVEAEILDLVLVEALDNQEKVIEIDTTNRDPENVAEEIERRIEEDDTGYGDTDWTDYL